MNEGNILEVYDGWCYVPYQKRLHYFDNQPLFTSSEPYPIAVCGFVESKRYNVRIVNWEKHTLDRCTDCMSEDID